MPSRSRIARTLHSETFEGARLSPAFRPQPEMELIDVIVDVLSRFNLKQTSILELAFRTGVPTL